MRNWIKALGGALAVAFVAAGLYTIFVNVTEAGDPEGNPTPTSSPTLTRDGESGVIQVAASTNVWGSVIEILGGEWVEVTSIVSDPLQDPHSYEASARDQLSLSEAELIVANGGGYDEFMDQLVAALEGDRVFLKLVEGEHSHTDEEHSHEGENHSDEATTTSDEHDHEHGNEHIWYDFHLVAEASEMIVEAIVELRPEAFDTVNANYDFFISELDNLEIRKEALRDRALGTGFIAAEGVGNLMLEEAGFVNQTPEALADAIEEEREVPPAALSQASDLLSGRIAGLLVVNQQVSDLATEELRSIADENNIPVVELSELIPETDMDYLDWMASVLDHLQEAVY